MSRPALAVRPRPVAPARKTAEPTARDVRPLPKIEEDPAYLRRLDAERLDDSKLDAPMRKTTPDERRIDGERIDEKHLHDRFTEEQPVETADTGPAQSSASKGKKRGRKPVAAEAQADKEPDAEAMPEPESGTVILPRAPPANADATAAFQTPAPPDFRAQPGKTVDAKEKDAAIAVFAQAMAAASRLHARLLRDADDAVARVQASADRLGSGRQRDLDDNLTALGASLGAARARLDGAADAADASIDAHAAATRADIQRAAKSALGTLGAAKTAADKSFGEKATAEMKRTKADGQAARVTAAGGAASAKVSGLPGRAAKDNPIDGAAAMAAAQNEKIIGHLPQHAPGAAEAYTKEAAAELRALTKSFTEMETSLKKSLGDVVTAMTGTATSSSSSIGKARDGALKQLKASAKQAHGSVAQARAGGHAALIRQHNQSRAQIVAVARDCGQSEEQSARTRALRGAGAAQALATAQQAGARTLADTLTKESTKPPAELAKIVKSSATTLRKTLETTGSDQRERLRRNGEIAEPRAAAQSLAAGLRAGVSAQAMGEALAAAAEQSGTQIGEQTAQAVAPFEQLPDTIAKALGGALPAAKAGYASQLAQADKALGLADSSIESAMTGKGGSGGSGGAAAAPDADAAREIPEEFITRTGPIAKDGNADKEIEEFRSSTRATVLKIINDKAGALDAALMQTSTPIESVMVQLRGITGLQGSAIAAVYGQQFKRSLRADLEKELRKALSAGSTDDANVAAALAYLSGNRVEGARQEMKAAVNYSNEEGRAERAQRSLSPAELDELNRLHPEEMRDVEGDLDGNEQKAVTALNTIRGARAGETQQQKDKREERNIAALGLANAFGLQAKLDQARKKKGEAGGDAASEALAAFQAQIGSDILSGGDAMGPQFDDPQAEQRKAKLRAATGHAFDEVVTTLPDGSPNVPQKGEKQGLSSIARYAAAARPYTEFVPGDGRHGGRWETKSVGLDPRQTELLDALAKTGPDSEETAAATMLVELNRASGPPREDKMRAAMGSDLLAAREGESDAARKKRLDGGDLKKSQERRQKILKQYGALAATHAPKVEGQAAAPPRSTDEVKGDILGKLDARFSNDPTAKAYTRSMVEKLEPDPVAAFDFAIAHEEKNKETLLATTGRMTRTEIDEATAKWNDKHPGGPSLYQKLGLYEEGDGDSILEGDARNEVELKFMGVPRDDRERAEVANMASKQQVRDSGALGRSMASEEYGRMLANQGQLLDMMGVKAEDIDARGRIKATGRDGKPITASFDKDGKLILKPGASREAFETALQFSTIHAEGYKAAVDRAAAGVTMALMIVAAAITTFVTFGGAAAFWGPVLITAGAGLVGMAMTAAIKGDRYTKAEIQRDLVMTFVQAATAGLASYVGAARGAAEAARNAAKVAGQSEKLVQTIAGVAGKQALGKGAKALQFGKELAIDAGMGAGSNAINNAAGAAMDPENRRQGKSGEKAFEGGIKGLASGAVGAALTKPLGSVGKRFDNRLQGVGGRVGTIARSASSGGTRIAGNVVGGYGGRVAEARVGQALGDPHQSWNVSLEGAKEGVAQDAIQGLAEHGAEGVAERRAAKKTAAARAAVDAPAIAAEPDGPARTAAVRDALPADAKSAVETAVPAAPPARPPPLPETAAPRRAADAPPVQPAPSRRDDPPVTPAPRNRPADENAPPSARSTGDIDDDGPVTVRGPAPQGPIHNVAEGYIDHPDGTREFLHVPETSVMMAKDAKSHAEAEDFYYKLIEDRPTHEVGVYYNPKTGEYILIQGNPSQVTVEGAGSTGQSPHPEGMAQRWKEILPQDEGHWELQAHYHPDYADPAAHPALKRLPSSEDADFGTVKTLAEWDGVARSSVIHYSDGAGGYGETRFGYDPAAKRPYWVEFENPRTGKRDRQAFRSTEEYDRWVGRLLGTKPPDTAATPARTPDTGDAPIAPAPGLPRRPPAADEIELFHGTTRAGSGAIGETGIQPQRKPGDAEDFGQGFYMTREEHTARAYAEDRARKHPDQGGPDVISATIKLADLGFVVDVREGGAHRAAWEAFLDASPSTFGPAAFALPGQPPFFKNAREYLYGKQDASGNLLTMPMQERGRVFETFLTQHDLGHAGAIRGDLGKAGTEGIGRGEQVAIRSPDVAARVSKALGGQDVPVQAPPPVTKAPGNRAPATAKPEKQGKRVLDPAEARRRTEEVERQRARATELEAQERAAKARAEGVEAERAQLIGEKPDRPAAARAVVDELLKITDKDERLDELRARLAADGEIDPATRKFLEWQERAWAFQLAQEQAARTLASSPQQQREAALVDIPKAEAAQRDATRPVKDRMRQTGPNYRDMKRKARVDGVFSDPADFRAREAAAGAAIPLSPDHLIPLDEIANMPELTPLLDLHGETRDPLTRTAIEQALRDIGDVPDNLVPMQSDANSAMKRAKSWHEITYDQAAEYGYSVADVDRMRVREDDMRGQIKARIADLIRDYAEKIADEKSRRATVVAPAIPEGES